MDRLIGPGFFLGALAGVLAGVWFGLHPEARFGWLLAIGMVAGVAGTLLALLAALAVAPSSDSRPAGAGIGPLSIAVWFVVIALVAFGVAAAGAWLAGADTGPAAPPDLDASPGIWFRIWTWVGYAIGAGLAGIVLLVAGMTLFAKAQKAREQPRLAAARRFAAEGKLGEALAVCERAVGNGPVEEYHSKSDALREMARLAVVLLQRLGRHEDARRRYAAIEAKFWNRELALFAEEIGYADRALEIWETLARRGETREEDRPRIEQLRSRPQGGTHP